MVPVLTLQNAATMARHRATIPYKPSAGDWHGLVWQLSLQVKFTGKR
jgi:hypothetical protein